MAKSVKMKIKRKKGSKVTIKSKAWYHSKKNSHGFVETGICGFCAEMAGYCGMELTIAKSKIDPFDNTHYYKMVEDDGKFYWDENMFQGL